MKHMRSKNIFATWYCLEFIEMKEINTYYKQELEFIEIKVINTYYKQPYSLADAQKHRWRQYTIVHISRFKS